MFLNYRTVVFLSIIIVATVGAGTAEALTYQSYVFGTYEMILFSYEDGTDLQVDGSGQTLWSGTLDKGEHHLVFLSGVGAYEVAGSNQFAVLVGDAAARGKSGYYAMDQNGRGSSTEFYSYIPPKASGYGNQKFVVFAYEDGTEVTVEKDQGNGSYTPVVTNHALNKGEQCKTENLSGKYLHVTSNKPVSALSCYDTGYFVPSVDGRWPEMSMCAYV